MTSNTFHLALDVAELDRSVDFYTRLFGAGPARREPDYARFELADPPVVLSLNPTAKPSKSSWPNHLGLRLADAAALAGARERVVAAGLTTREEQGVECCYARQDKVWLDDPDGNPWELYIVTEADLAERGEPTVASEGCCAPECCT